MHGEYKTPGGKLVVVDLEVRGDQFQQVEVSGDFFLYPEEALAAITGAIDGLPADTDEAGIARAVERAIPEGTELLGTSPAGIAIAVCRALAGGTEGIGQS